MLSCMEHVSHNNTVAQGAGSVSFADYYIPSVSSCHARAVGRPPSFPLGLCTSSPCVKGSITKDKIFRMSWKLKNIVRRSFLNILAVFDEFTRK
jgi:hypothetical protein